MNEKIEGTLILDGLIEATLPSDADAEQKLRDWVRFAASLGLRFSLELDGSAISVLADNRPVRVDELKADPTQLVADTLGQFLSIFPPPERPHVFSTVRSIAIRKGLEVQTLYVVATDGTIDVRQEMMEAATKAPPERMSRKQKVRLGLMGVAAALAIFGISAIFVDYRGLFSDIARAVGPLDVDALEIDAAAFDPYFTVAGRATGPRDRSIVLTLRRTDAFPRTDAHFEEAAGGTKGSYRALLALEAVARGYVRCELFDRKARFLAFTFLRVRGLAEQETVEVEIPLPRDARPTRIVLTY